MQKSKCKITPPIGGQNSKLPKKLKNYFPQPKCGFTLIETIIAIAILTIGVLSVFQIFPFIFKITETGNRTTAAANLAQGTLETELDNNYEDIVVGEGASSPYAPPFSNYNYQTSISYINQNLEMVETDQGLKKIIVTVSWNERGKIKQTQLATVVDDN